MIRLTFSQMRHSIGRLSAAGIAIAIGTAFIVVTLLGGNVITRTTYDSIAASFADADIIVGVQSTPEIIAAIENVPGVDAALANNGVYLELVGPKNSAFQYVIGASPEPRLDSQEAVEGRTPTATGEIAIPQDLAKRIGAEVGSTLTIPPGVTYDDNGEPFPSAGQDRPFTVVGLLDDPFSAFSMFGGAGVVSQADLTELMAGASTIVEAGQIAVALTPGASVPAAIEAITQALDNPELIDPARGYPAPTVLTKDEQAALSAADFTGGEEILTSVVLAFAGLALLVAGLVIANTFQVLVAQRTRTLAMLRCVGANKRQLRASVLLEAALLGLVASGVGIALGAGVGQLALTIAGSMDLGVPLPAAITLTPAVFIAPILAGIGVTVIAAFSPARAATRVSPLAALRPADAPSMRDGGGLVRLILASIMAVIGFGLLGLGILVGQSDSPDIGLLVGLAGGALSFIGVVVGAVFWIPAVTKMIGKVVSLTGASGKLAAANTVRNPRRTAATSTALLIGVTLVVMMSTGAISARNTLNNGLDEQYPVDVSVISYTNDPGTDKTSLTPDVQAQVRAIEGVKSVMPILSTFVSLNKADVMQVNGIDLDQAKSTVNDSALLTGLTDTTILISRDTAANYYITEGDLLTLTTATSDGTDPSHPRSVTLTVKITSGWIDEPFISASTMETLNRAAAPSVLWISLDPSADAYDTTTTIQEMFDGQDAYVTGAVVERAMFQQVIDTLLAIIVGLLAVAVVIALIGVANTLSLSVIERQRENAMLRAIGLSKRQLRQTLAIEGILIATVGTALGAILGLGYGWAGSLTILSIMGDVSLSVPWRDLGLVLIVALVAGLVASVIPANKAARTSPVEALSVD